MNGDGSTLAGVVLALVISSGCAAFGRAPTSDPARAPTASAPGPTASAKKPAPAPGPDEDSELDDEDEELPDDGGDPFEDASHEPAMVRPHPLDGWSDERVADAVKGSLASLGPMSLGSPSAGLLLNGVQAQGNSYYEPVAPGGAWATEETLAYLEAALVKVHAEIPGTSPLKLGDISQEKGGPLSPHLSHQSGRDVDISYFYNSGTAWYRRGNAQNLDLPRNWAFVRSLVTETDVEMILIDHSIQRLLIDHALSIGEDPDWVDSIFRGGDGKRPLVRHARGHATHIHIRFYNPIAQETARRAHDALVAARIVPPVQHFIHHRARRGDTLGKLAKRYGTTIPAIKRANRLKSSLIRERRTYLIPAAKPRPGPASKRLTFPERRLPPARERSPEKAAGATLATGRDL